MHTSSRRSVVGALTAALGAIGCGASSEKGAVVGRIPDPTLPWNSPESEAAQRDLPPPARSPDKGYYDFALSMDGTLLAAALPFAPSNALIVVDIASRRGWHLKHPHRRVLVTNPSFLPDGRLALVVTPPPLYFGVSEIWINDVRGASSACISGRPPYRYGKPHFSGDSAQCLTFREANPGQYPQSVGMPRREYREPPPVSLFEIDLATGEERQLSQRVFQDGRAFYAGDRTGYYLSTSPPLIRGRPPWPGGPAPYTSPNYSTIDADETYPFNGFFVAANDEISERPTGVIPNSLFQLDETRGSHAKLEDVDRNGQLVISYQHPHESAAFGLCESAAIISGSEILRRIELGGPRLDSPRISGDGQTVVGLLGARREYGVDVSFPRDDQPLVFVIDRNGARDFLSVADIAFQEPVVVLQAHANAEIV